jgi:phosphoglycerate dehydrogenase-like enzyme
MQRVFLQYNVTAGLQAQLDAFGPDDLAIISGDVETDGRPHPGMAEAEVLWHMLAPISGPLIAASPKLRLIQKIGVGVNTIDLEAAKARGIAVCNMPGTNTRAVAEMTLGLMLAVLRRLVTLDAAVRADRGWAEQGAGADRYGEIGGRTVGLVGYGAVPAMLAPVLQAMGAEVLFWCRSPRTGACGTAVPMETLLERSDIVSLHLPLAEGTARLIDRAALARMRQGSILVNTARGGLVDEPALIEALRSGHLGGAGLDVFATEPVEAGNPLLAMEQVVVAPHVAWLTPETMQRSLVVAVENCRRLRRGEPLLHRVV